jgi:hypothetical protein
MIKNIGKLALLIVICALLKFSLSSNKKFETINVNEKQNTSNIIHKPLFAFNSLNVKFNPTLGKSFIGFKEALGFKESRGDYFIVNKFGYLGKYQFGKETLKMIGIFNPNQFLQNPELQEKAFIANAQRNKWILRKDIERFNGMTINGVRITESGILAAAHLAGPGSVKKYLRSYGANGFKDAFGTSIQYYIKKFSGYDTSSIIPDKKAKAMTI